MLVQSEAYFCPCCVSVCVSVIKHLLQSTRKAGSPLVNSPCATMSQPLYLTSHCSVLSFRPFDALFDGRMNSNAILECCLSLFFFFNAAFGHSHLILSSVSSYLTKHAPHPSLCSFCCLTGYDVPAAPGSGLPALTPRGSP